MAHLPWFMRFACESDKGVLRLRGMEAYDALLDSLEKAAATGKLMFDALAPARAYNFMATAK